MVRNLILILLILSVAAFATRILNSIFALFILGMISLLSMIVLMYKVEGPISDDSERLWGPRPPKGYSADGWQILFPLGFYVTVHRLVFGSGMWFFVSLSMLILVLTDSPLMPFSIIWYIIFSLSLGKAFGGTTAFCIILIFMPVVKFVLLAFGNNRYSGPIDLLGILENIFTRS